MKHGCKDDMGHTNIYRDRFLIASVNSPFLPRGPMNIKDYSRGFYDLTISLVISESFQGRFNSLCFL